MTEWRTAGIGAVADGRAVALDDPRAVLGRTLGDACVGFGGGRDVLERAEEEATGILELELGAGSPLPQAAAAPSIASAVRPAATRAARRRMPIRPPYIRTP
jgi:hypothetical protein